MSFSFIQKETYEEIYVKIEKEYADIKRNAIKALNPKSSFGESIANLDIYLHKFLKHLKSLVDLAPSSHIVLKFNIELELDNEINYSLTAKVDHDYVYFVGFNFSLDSNGVIQTSFEEIRLHCA